MPRNALNLVWCDLEFTDLDVSRARILQAAMLVTTPELDPIFPAGGGPDGLSLFVRITPREAAAASDWVRENQAELLARCQTDPAGLPLVEVEGRMLAYLQATCEIPGEGASDPREKAVLRTQNPLLAGNSVHKDHSVLERWMPAFTSRLSYRLVDVSGLKELRRRWYPQVAPFEKESMARDWLPDLVLDGAEHDALYDVKCSLAELRYYRKHLFR
jgi:oligoribonuclease